MKNTPYIPTLILLSISQKNAGGIRTASGKKWSSERVKRRSKDTITKCQLRN